MPRPSRLPLGRPSPGNGSRNWLLPALIAACTSLGGALGYFVSARFNRVETRQDLTEADVGVLKIKVEILEGGDVRLDVPIDKVKLEKLVMDEIRRQVGSPRRD